MSEKRFTVDDDGIYDNQEKKHFKFIAYDWIDCDIDECCEKLNEQQSKITELEIELTDCKNRKEQSEYNLHKKIRELENKFDKIPPKIKELWVE